MIVVAGEALVDLVAEEDGRYRAVPGGSPANVAVGLSRLGVRTHMLARLGTGRFGRIIREHLSRNGVGLDLAVDSSEPATLAVVSLDTDGRAAYDFYVDGTADWGWSPAELPVSLPTGTTAFCTGSLAVALEPGATAITDLMRRTAAAGVSIVLDPNLRPALLGERATAMRRLEAQIALADVVKVSDEDLAWVAPDENPADVAARLLDLGPKLVVVTLGAAGAFASTLHGARVVVPAHPIEVVDTVGAGDAFTAGLVDALGRYDLLGGDARDHLGRCTDATLQAVVARAALIAGLTCARRGADPPTAAEVAAVS
ncbi:MAG TPA: carbohydrate kinase [Jiangellaceae bacterium]|nr:carbohydrate kinase [Jiangellaceae bacterium]